jgi:hypothetical protein
MKPDARVITFKERTFKYRQTDINVKTFLKCMWRGDMRHGAEVSLM